MSYSNFCGALGCTHILFWSNPNINYIDCDPLGVPENTCTGFVGCDADNVRTLNNARLTVANFREATTATPIPTRTLTLTPTATKTPSPTKTFTLSPTPPYNVLPVGEDVDFSDVRASNLEPLKATQAAVTPWSVVVSGEPNATQMASNVAVIWFTGDN